MKTKTIDSPSLATARSVAIYARVSSEEQTKGNYPSCDSQVEELVAACRSRGWNVRQVIKDEGFSAGSLKRPGLSEMRYLVESGEISAVLCAWYDRLTRSRDFYVLDKEFQKHGVQFVTLHDATDTKTAAGRFMECMLVAAKTYEREQTSEKVRSKMRMRIAPNSEQVTTLNEMFRIYNETGSDFKVRDYLIADPVDVFRRDTACRVRWKACRFIERTRHAVSLRNTLIGLAIKPIRYRREKGAPSGRSARSAKYSPTAVTSCRSRSTAKTRALKAYPKRKPIE